jgi:hypothetical protein
MAKGKNNTPVDGEDELHDVAAAADGDYDFGVELSESEKLALEKEAKAEVLKQIKLSKAKAFKQAAKDRIKADMLFRSAKDATGADLVTVALMLASHPKYIMLDGAVYHSGRKYTVTRPVASVLLDQMHRGWEQEYARISKEERGNLKRQRNFMLKQQAEGEYGLVQVS